LGQLGGLQPQDIGALRGYKVKSVGKPDAVVPHVWFDAAGAEKVTKVEL